MRIWTLSQTPLKEGRGNLWAPVTSIQLRPHPVWPTGAYFLSAHTSVLYFLPVYLSFILHLTMHMWSGVLKLHIQLDIKEDTKDAGKNTEPWDAGVSWQHLKVPLYCKHQQPQRQPRSDEAAGVGWGGWAFHFACKLMSTLTSRTTDTIKTH